MSLFPVSNVAPSTDLNVSVSLGEKGQLHIRWTRDLRVNDNNDRKARWILETETSAQWVGTIEAYAVQTSPDVCTWLAEHYPNAVYDEDAKIACLLSRRLLEQAARRTKLIAEYMADGKVPKTDYQFKRAPMNHQIVGFECIRHAPFMGVLWEMGTGKTKVMSDSLSAMAQDFGQNRPMRVLICCPRAVVINWVRELAMDVTVPYKVAIATYISAYFREQLEELNCVKTGCGDVGAVEAVLSLIKHKDVQMQVLVINYEALKGRIDLLKKIGFDVCVLDEAHKIKNFSSKTTKYCLELAETVNRRYIMTGTPWTQSALDLFSQFEFLAPGQGLLGYTTYYAYQHNYVKMGGYKGRQVVENQTPGKLLEHASRWSMTVKKEQCLDLPPKVYEVRNIQMSLAQQRVYDQVATEVLIVLESLGAEVTVQNILVQYLRLAQVTSGYIKTIDGKEVKINGATGKIDALMEILEENNFPKTVVWTRFVHELNDVVERLTEAGVKCVKYYGEVNATDRQLAIDSFQDDDQTRVFVGIAQAGGVGVNLTEGELVVYLSNDFSLTNRLQSEDRVHRKGQTKTVTYVDVMMEDSIDELVIERLGRKRDAANYFSDPQEIAKSLRDFLSLRRS